jgi:hypothetical protein
MPQSLGNLCKDLISDAMQRISVEWPLNQEGMKRRLQAQSFYVAHTFGGAKSDGHRTFITFWLILIIDDLDKLHQPLN